MIRIFVSRARRNIVGACRPGGFLASGFGVNRTLTSSHSPAGRAQNSSRSPDGYSVYPHLPGATPILDGGRPGPDSSSMMGSRAPWAFSDFASSGAAAGALAFATLPAPPGASPVSAVDARQVVNAKTDAATISAGTAIASTADARRLAERGASLGAFSAGAG